MEARASVRLLRARCYIMQQLLNDIKNDTYKPVYLLYGDEAYLRLQYKDRLKKALVNEDDTMNYSYYQGKDVHVPEVIDLSETMPFLADRRVIILENTDFVKNGNEELAEYISGGVNDTTVIIMVETSVDKRTKLYKTIDKQGRCVCFETQSDETLKKWILGRLKKENKQITGHTLDVFLETVGTDMYAISMELEKLLSYTMNRDVITEKDIEDVCCVRLANRIFDMIAKIGMKQGSEALNMYHELLALKESPFGILALIVRQFNQMLQIEDLLAQRYSQKEIASRVGLSPYIVGKYIPQVKQFTAKEMRVILEKCAKTDYGIKSGHIEAELAVELLIIESSR